MITYKTRSDPMPLGEKGRRKIQKEDRGFYREPGGWEPKGADMDKGKGL